ncbi:30S ribosomal protein S20 [bacterium (Candidatus Blackallbacteria) CG17_big_fil_post_rev_8_21_14_2_50_48_46]|uniref:Small ribosomal subunit protein bS20 n=1 Tax=bacterium (Candidatus Blackallbacteria) CG17_big_fil_post_rev_8_21_14_2_50_48_46 TaxID=2014261 RepID=A0A2M7FYR1_9BACT|nr:MAG: 30S ribosomal protein S20 [bacterium (Candidatus Blackallbacteria) CG18_big_fil_WC_8_21_14_2_50_49_26]PIW13906.1 MAG: 30S ribosomal protein S20 [bacterium (Candidatus Blackallbacteria) CG17_big_fil_post_rev_8_21_14_2_50_48_46]PIW45132.1 MAG: 30S ribosomal protein S20 [bacterium (Candidatus Blackallbacteria) CG13_big_fil_rev_8_21_14_2_50_49_14]
MANYKSAKKRIKVADRNRVQNSLVKSRARTAMKKVVRALGDNSTDLESLTKLAVSELDKAQAKGVLHKNAVARHKSRLMKKVNATAQA